MGENEHTRRWKSDEELEAIAEKALRDHELRKRDNPDLYKERFYAFRKRFSTHL